MKSSVIRLALVLALAPLGACASITQGTSQNVTVNTRPPEAQCDLHRAGERIASVSTTPSTIRIGKSGNDIEVSCTKDEHEDAKGTLSSSFQTMTLGNLLLGGFVGLAIDASTGAATEYPPSIVIVLPPKSFDTPEERDEFYEPLVAEVKDQAERASAEIRRICQGDREECEEDVKRVEELRDQEILELEEQKARARILSEEEPVVAETGEEIVIEEPAPGAGVGLEPDGSDPNAAVNLPKT